MNNRIWRNVDLLNPRFVCKFIDQVYILEKTSVSTITDVGC